MIELFDKDTGVRLGEITEEQLRFLIDQLEEEHEEDQDYYINSATLDMFSEKGIDSGMLNLLRGALGDREEMEIQWTRKV